MHDDIAAVFAAIAFACVVAVWAMSPTVGGKRRSFKATPHEQNAPGRGAA